MIWMIIYGLIAWAAVYYWWRRQRELELLPDYKSKAVLITGCDSGFGNGLAFKCLAEGMTVFAACINQQGADEVQAKSKTYPGKCYAFPMDVTKPESIEEARKRVEEVVGPDGLHGLVNNAGVAGEFVWDEWQSPEAYQFCFDVNALGVIRMTHAFRKMLKKTKGRIVNVTSSFAVSAPAQLGPYACSKYACEAYSDVTRRELAPFGITVCIVTPGFLRTPMNKPEFALAKMEKAWLRQSDEIKEEYGEAFYRFTCATTRARYYFLSDPQLVVDDYFHALVAKHPRTRYRPGIDSVLYYTMSAHFPTKLQDWWFQIHPGYTVKHPRDCVGVY